MVALVLKSTNLPLLVFCENLRSFAWYIGNRHTQCQIEADRPLIGHDHVIEHMIGPVSDRASLLNWLTDLITLGLGRSDVIPVTLVHKASDDKVALASNEIALTLCASRERRRETFVQRQAFAKTRKDVWGHDMPEVFCPISVGCGARREGLA